MALRWIEGFETFGGNGTTFGSSGIPGFVSKYPAPTCNTADGIVSGRNSGLALKGFNTHFLIQGLNASSTYTIGFAFQFDASAITTTNENIIQLLDTTTNNAHIQLQHVLVSSNPVLRVLRNGTTLGTGTTVLTSSTWYYIELTVFVNTTTGTAQTIINGVTDLNLTNVNTNAGGAGTISSVYIGTNTTSSSHKVYLDDLYIRDDSTVLGDHLVEALTPNGVGTYSGWSPTSGSNYTNINDNPYTATGDVRTNASSTKDTYTYTDLSRVKGNIVGIQINSVVSRTNATTQTVQALVYRSSILSGGTNYSIPNTTIYQNYTSIFETDPTTMLSWLTSSVNGSEFGLQKV